MSTDQAVAKDRAIPRQASAGGPSRIPAATHHRTNSVLARFAFVRHSIDMSDSVETHAPILAAGGIVLQEGSRPRFAIVRLRRDKSWVLPKGKLCMGERALAAAKREVMEETGHDVSVHGFLGTMLYSEASGRIKIVQFWHMRVISGPERELMPDVKAVKWLSLKQAIDTLTRVHEKVFLANVGPVALEAARQFARGKSNKPFANNNGNRWVRGRAVAPTTAWLRDERAARLRH